MPIKVPNWFINKKGICSNCTKDKNIPKLFSNENNMHFSKIPDELKNLTLAESMLILKFTVAMHVHLLKYGMLASKGHSISVPQNNFQITTSLPLLPSQVSVLLIRKQGTKSKIYTVQRHKVQNALFALCFGIPFYGLDSPTDLINYKYEGPDHISGIALNDKYFSTIPNYFYHDVRISTDNLEKLPIERKELPGIPEIPLESEFDTNLDEEGGPANEQYDKLDPNSDLVSRSGIIMDLSDIDLDFDTCDDWSVDGLPD